MSWIVHRDASDEQSVRRIFEGIGLRGRSKIESLLSIVDGPFGDNAGQNLNWNYSKLRSSPQVHTFGSIQESLPYE